LQSKTIYIFATKILQGVARVAKTVKKDPTVRHLKDVKKHVTSLSKQVRKREAALQKEFAEHAENLSQVKQDVLETKAHYQHIPKLTMETQMMIESMNKLTAVVKQLLILFNKKMDAEEGPLFIKLNEIAEQNEKIAEGILTVADLVKSEQTPAAQIKSFNPYIPKQGPEPMQVMPQMSTPQEPLQMPEDFGKFQEPTPIPQFSAPLPVNAPLEEKPISRKRMLF
jgi:hypothetical protein